MITAAKRPTDAMTPAPDQRRRGAPLRLVAFIAAVFAMLAVLGGGAGLALGKLASTGAAEHRYHQYTASSEHWHGPGLFGDGDR
jgi:hypothetical protein